MRLMIAGGTSGKSLAVNKRTGTQTFMKMLQVQGGLGFGVSKNQLIFVLTSEQLLSHFMNAGWEFGGEANLLAMADCEGGMFTGAAKISPGVYLYQITETGFNATLAVAGASSLWTPIGTSRRLHRRALASKDLARGTRVVRRSLQAERDRQRPAGGGEAL
jgi:lipid-binding SYLF domain-containing protein